MCEHMVSKGNIVMQAKVSKKAVSPGTKTHRETIGCRLQ